jgi:predicted phosphodiesterase
MRLAVLADIHGNLPALEAAIDDLARREADAVVNLGDCASGPLWPRETLGLLMRLGWPTVRGNHDRWLGLDPPEEMGPSDRYAYDQTSAEERTWLAALPVRLDLAPRIAAFHARPDDDNAYLLEDVRDGRLAPATDAVLAARLGGIDAAAILTGHSHLPALRRLTDARLVVNPGSVGVPAYNDTTPPAHVSESGAPHARYALLQLDAGLVTGVDLVALSYDHETAARRAEENGRPEWAFALRTGRMPD